jgi:hypothetical protein
MATYTANAAAVGTALVAAAGTITGLTLTQPTATSDMTTPVILLDQAAAPASAAAAALPPRTLFASPVANLLPDVTPGIPWPGTMTGPAWPLTLGLKASFTKGIFVASCPANVTLTITA